MTASHLAEDLGAFYHQMWSFVNTLKLGNSFHRKQLVAKVINLIQTGTKPHSEREKQVTTKGERFVRTTVETGGQFIQDLAHYRA